MTFGLQCPVPILSSEGRVAAEAREPGGSAENPLSGAWKVWPRRPCVTCCLTEPWCPGTAVRVPRPGCQAPIVSGLWPGTPSALSCVPGASPPPAVAGLWAEQVWVTPSGLTTFQQSHFLGEIIGRAQRRVYGKLCTLMKIGMSFELFSSEFCKTTVSPRHLSVCFCQSPVFS